VLSTLLPSRSIDIAEMEGWTLDLVRAARVANPGNANLHQVADMLSLGSTRDREPAALNFEKVVCDGQPFLNPAEFRSKLGRTELQVCWSNSTASVMAAVY
jgi:hypothetical protein